ncbi:MAG: hypothetical protein WBQ11_10065, partial [Isosphaeraceae bacterium]
MTGADPAEIEAALKLQQPVWSMGTRNPKTRHTNQLYLDEVPELRRALLTSRSTLRKGQSWNHLRPGTWTICARGLPRS